MSDDLTTTESNNIDEEIVAYLDGELDSVAEAQVVRRLSEDAAYRSRLGQLQQAWDMLDNLRRTEADDEFVQSTVAMVAVQAEVEAKTQKLRVQRRRSLGWLAIAAVALCSVGGGFAAIHRRMTRENRNLIRDLPVVEHIDEYRYLDDIEFLKQLERENLFAVEVDDGM